MPPKKTPSQVSLFNLLSVFIKHVCMPEIFQQACLDFKSAGQLPGELIPHKYTDAIERQFAKILRKFEIDINRNQKIECKKLNAILQLALEIDTLWRYDMSARPWINVSGSEPAYQKKLTALMELLKSATPKQAINVRGEVTNTADTLSLEEANNVLASFVNQLTLRKTYSEFFQSTPSRVSSLSNVDNLDPPFKPFQPGSLSFTNKATTCDPSACITFRRCFFTINLHDTDDLSHPSLYSRALMQPNESFEGIEPVDLCSVESPSSNVMDYEKLPCYEYREIWDSTFQNTILLPTLLGDQITTDLCIINSRGNKVNRYCDIRYFEGGRCQITFSTSDTYFVSYRAYIKPEPPIVSQDLYKRLLVLKAKYQRFTPKVGRDIALLQGKKYFRRLTQENTGRCELRCIAAFLDILDHHEIYHLTKQELRLSYSDIHVVLSVWLDGAWRTLNLGGYECQQKEVPHALDEKLTYDLDCWKEFASKQLLPILNFIVQSNYTAHDAAAQFFFQEARSFIQRIDTLERLDSRVVSQVLLPEIFKLQQALMVFPKRLSARQYNFFKKCFDPTHSSQNQESDLAQQLNATEILLLAFKDYLEENGVMRNTYRM